MSIIIGIGVVTCGGWGSGWLNDGCGSVRCVFMDAPSWLTLADSVVPRYSVENSYLEEKEDTCNSLGEIAENVE